MLNLSNASLSDLLIGLPALSEQEEIVAKLGLLASRVDSLVTIYKRKLERLAELKQTILRKAFAGELTAQKALPAAAE